MASKRFKLLPKDTIELSFSSVNNDSNNNNNNRVRLEIIHHSINRNYIMLKAIDDNFCIELYNLLTREGRADLANQTNRKENICLELMMFSNPIEQLSQQRSSTPVGATMNNPFDMEPQNKRRAMERENSDKPVVLATPTCNSLKSNNYNGKDEAAACCTSDPSNWSKFSEEEDEEDHAEVSPTTPLPNSSNALIESQSKLERFNLPPH